MNELTVINSLTCCSESVTVHQAYLLFRLNITAEQMPEKSVADGSCCYRVNRWTLERSIPQSWNIYLEKRFTLTYQKERKQLVSLTLSVCKRIICVFAQAEHLQLLEGNLHVLWELVERCVERMGQK